MDYEEKKKLADAYLNHKTAMGWNDLPDVNSLHDAETKEDTFNLCDERLEEAGFPFDSLNEE